MRLRDRARPPFTGTFTGRIGKRRSLTEGPLHGGEPVSQRRGVHRTEIRCARGDQCGQSIDQNPCLGQICLPRGAVVVGCQTAGDGGCGQQVHGNREHDLHGGNIGDIQAGRRPCGHLIRGRLLGRLVIRGGGGAIGHG